MAEIERKFKCNCKEVSISHNGISYLVICGKHINGAYCVFPKLNVAVELSGYDGDYGYNEKNDIRPISAMINMSHHLHLHNRYFNYTNICSNCK